MHSRQALLAEACLSPWWLYVWFIFSVVNCSSYFLYLSGENFTEMKILPYMSTQEGVAALERTLQAISPLVRVKRDEAGLYVISREGYVELDPVTSHMESYLMFAVMNQGYALDVTG